MTQSRRVKLDLNLKILPDFAGWGLLLTHTQACSPMSYLQSGRHTITTTLLGDAVHCPLLVFYLSEAGGVWAAGRALSPQTRPEKHKQAADRGQFLSAASFHCFRMNNHRSVSVFKLAGPGLMAGQQLKAQGMVLPLHFKLLQVHQGPASAKSDCLRLVAQPDLRGAPDSD